MVPPNGESLATVRSVQWWTFWMSMDAFGFGIGLRMEAV